MIEVKINHLTIVCNTPAKVISVAALLSEVNCITDVVFSIMHQRTAFSLAKCMFILERQKIFISWKL